MTEQQPAAAPSSDGAAARVCGSCKQAPATYGAMCTSCRSVMQKEAYERSLARATREMRVCAREECGQMFEWISLRPRQRHCSKRCYMADRDASKSRARAEARPPREVLPDGMKRCSRCGEVKEHDAFSRNVRTSDGYQVQCKACQSQWQRENPERRRETWRRYRRDTYLQRTHGLTQAEYDLLYEGQDRACAICRRPGGDPRPGRQPLHVDHDHALEGQDHRVRGLLDKPCNTMLGNAGDDPRVLVAGALYLARGSGYIPASLLTMDVDELVARIEQALR